MQTRINGKLLRKLSNVKRNPETRLLLKRKLDHFASGKATISELQDCLNSGPPRTIQISKDEIIVSMKESKTSFIWQLSDPRTAVACLGVTGEYEPLETIILKFFGSKSQTIIDVGANIGYYAVELSATLSPSATIHAFEPVPASFKQLENNVVLNSLSNFVFCNQLAISVSDGTMLLYIPRISGSSASSAKNLHPEEAVEKIQVPMTKLDNYIHSQNLKSFDLLKIDVEGAELMVIEGGIDSVKKYKPVIFAELLRKWSAQFGYSPNDVLKILIPIGYRCFGVSENLPEIIDINQETNETNFLFVPLEKMDLMDQLKEKVKGIQ